MTCVCVSVIYSWNNMIFPIIGKRWLAGGVFRAVDWDAIVGQL